jgi:hypothetical protein
VVIPLQLPLASIVTLLEPPARLQLTTSAAMVDNEIHPADLWVSFDEA